jgi:hypothetical protein
MSRLIDLTGRTFGLLTVLNTEGHDRRGYIRWRCRCECGRESTVLGYSLNHGRTKSCGCGVGGRKNISAEGAARQSLALQRGVRTCSTRVNALAAPTVRPGLRDIAWAAGLYEGEGSCSRSGSGRRSWAGMTVRVSQKDVECLLRLRDLFGGRVGREHAGAHNWSLCGARARGFILTIYAFLTMRRKAQVRRAIGKN